MKNFLWIGGAQWVDLVNTEKMRDGVRMDLLTSPDDALEWLREAKAGVEEFEVNKEFLGKLKNLRASLRALCEAAHENKAPSPQALGDVNAILASRALKWELQEGNTLQAREVMATSQGESVLYTLAREAALTLGTSARESLKPCANPACILWFLDTSKNRARRWCAMDECGNRLKVAAHYARNKATPKA